ncbi:WYL domain-containing protein [Pseudomonas cuatrocienegasensis]|uniref:WYL domain-containing protein n=1 Tax=Pseudomonas cuatrocienegasensis TaxID=543360 RepID=A0ABY1BFY7_9PSED|nr:WYL domain-containing protein [Pseudomonas sp. 21C1]SEQ76075.1 WYL domain-containing protein [Pseudomonas cuatrocienegasensis]
MTNESKPTDDQPTSKGRQGARWGQERRLEFIDYRLRWDGQINRSSLTDFFGISVPQASLDITEYAKLAESNLEYDTRARVYRATDSFKAVFPSSAVERYLEDLLRVAVQSEVPYGSFLNWQSPVAAVPKLGRRLNADIAGEILRAIREKEYVEVFYQSMNDPVGGERRLSPHALVHDGNRWHVRAYCHKRKDFRDFSLTRIKHCKYGGQDRDRADEDYAWHTIVDVVLIPHPGLTPAQRNLIEADFLMENGEMHVKCRQALLLYLLFQLNLNDDQADQRPEVIQLALKNKDEIKALFQY